MTGADLVVGGVLIPGASAPKLVSAAMIRKMQPGSVVVDVAIDQGGCFETSRATTHADPTYVVDGVTHYCVANMPGGVPRTSTFALNNATLPFTLALADKGWKRALTEDAHLRNGLNVASGQVTCRPVAEALHYKYVPPEAVMLGDGWAFDYVIVGGGTAGCVLANRLTADGRARVLMLEAGPRDNYPWIHIPIGYGKTMFHPVYNWGFYTEPEPGMNGRKIYWPRGRGLGGSSSINGLIYIRGQPDDYDAWARSRQPRLGLARRAAVFHPQRRQPARGECDARRRRTARVFGHRRRSTS